MRHVLVRSALMFVVVGSAAREASAQVQEACDGEECSESASPADNGQLPPPGFHRETVMNVPLVVGGLALTCIGTVVLTSGIVNAAEGGDSGDSEGLSDGVVMGVGGLTLAAGVGLILWGALGGPTVLVRNSRVSFAPVLERGGPGGTLRVVF
ncbi:MAG TPA: hypothetical protein VM686_38290 [Polyangiaceae bacterium]|nr:hypothetical protein [Polyangiaceae bacterium]